MSEKEKTDFVGVRLEPELGKRLRDTAWRRRLSVSELLRQAAIEKLEALAKHSKGGKENVIIE